MAGLLKLVQATINLFFGLWFKQPGTKLQKFIDCLHYSQKHLKACNILSHGQPTVYLKAIHGRDTFTAAPRLLLMTVLTQRVPNYRYYRYTLMFKRVRNKIVKNRPSARQTGARRVPYHYLKTAKISRLLNGSPLTFFFVLVVLAATKIIHL